MVELLLAKQTVVGSIPILRSINARVVQLAEALVLETRCWGFKSLLGHHSAAALAQLVEHLISNQVVGSSSLSSSTSPYSQTGKGGGFKHRNL